MVWAVIWQGLQYLGGDTGDGTEVTRVGQPEHRDFGGDVGSQPQTPARILKVRRILGEAVGNQGQACIRRSQPSDCYVGRLRHIQHEDGIDGPWFRCLGQIEDVLAETVDTTASIGAPPAKSGGSVGLQPKTGASACACGRPAPVDMPMVSSPQRLQPSRCRPAERVDLPMPVGPVRAS